MLIDQVESHLHPRWQRVLLPALLAVVSRLKAGATVQVIATTHAPLVLDVHFTSPAPVYGSWERGLPARS